MERTHVQMIVDTSDEIEVMIMVHQAPHSEADQLF